MTTHHHARALVFAILGSVWTFKASPACKVRSAWSGRQGVAHCCFKRRSATLGSVQRPISLQCTAPWDSVSCATSCSCPSLEMSLHACSALLQSVSSCWNASPSFLNHCIIHKYWLLFLFTQNNVICNCCTHTHKWLRDCSHALSNLHSPRMPAARMSLISFCLSALFLSAHSFSRFALSSG